jgi:multicomponent Na+:H+ antiporter subunit F
LLWLLLWQPTGLLRARPCRTEFFALDLLIAVGIGFIAVIAIKTRYPLYLDLAIALGLVGFLTTVAFARFILQRSYKEQQSLHEMDEDTASPAERTSL